jgi:hypothetical protein
MMLICVTSTMARVTLGTFTHTARSMLAHTRLYNELSLGAVIIGMLLSAKHDICFQDRTYIFVFKTVPHNRSYRCLNCRLSLAYAHYVLSSGTNVMDGFFSNSFKASENYILFHFHSGWMLFGHHPLCPLDILDWTTSQSVPNIG